MRNYCYKCAITMDYVQPTADKQREIDTVDFSKHLYRIELGCLIPILIRPQDPDLVYAYTEGI